MELKIVILMLVCNICIVCSDEKIPNSIYPPYTDKEKLEIKKFRELMLSELYRDYMKTDEYLIRWIRDADFDLDLAQQKLRKNIEWRKENKMDSIVNEDHSNILRQCPFVVKGHDKFGRPLGLLSIGKCDIRKIALTGKRDQLQRFMYYFLEFNAHRILQAQIEQNKDVRDGIIIVDGSGFNLRQHACLQCIPLFLSIFTSYENYYPGLLANMYLLNIPRIAFPVLDITLQALSAKTKAITKVYGFDRNEWGQALLKTIESSQLPVSFGGSDKEEIKKG